MTQTTALRWLTPEQAQAWIALVSTTVWLPAALDDQLRRDAGLTHVEYMVLSWLSMAPDHSARMSEIAARANVTLSHLSRIAARLEARGWMRRTPDPADGRATLAVLTPQGRDKVETTAPGHVEQVQRLVFDNLSPADVRHLRRIAEKLVKAAKPGICLPEIPAEPQG